MRKKLLILFLTIVSAVCLCIGITACGGSSGGNTDGDLVASKGLEYTLSDDGTYYIVSDIGTCTDTEIVIPSTYNGCAVTSIGSKAFYVCKSLTSITMPDSITSIGDEAFGCCSSLTSITIPDGVTSIVTLTFDRCYSLTDVILPDSVTSIGDSAFYYCKSLKSVIV